MLHAERTSSFWAGHTPSYIQHWHPWQYQDGESAASPFSPRAFNLSLTQISHNPCFLVLENFIRVLGRPQSTERNVIVSFLQIENVGNSCSRVLVVQRWQQGVTDQLLLISALQDTHAKRHSKQFSFFFPSSQLSDCK